MVNAIFSQIGSVVSAMVGTLKTALEGVIDLIWDSTANSNAGGLTTFGTLMLIGVGVGLVYFAFRLIRGLATPSATR